MPDSQKKRKSLLFIYLVRFPTVITKLKSIYSNYKNVDRVLNRFKCIKAFQLKQIHNNLQRFRAEPLRNNIVIKTKENYLFIFKYAVTLILIPL